jgi:membrane-associated protein
MDVLTEIVTWATEVIDSVSGLVSDSPLTYLLILSMAALDVVFPVLPAEGTVTAAGVLAGQGALSIAWVMVAAGLGAFLGDNFAYWTGRVAGRPLLMRVLSGNTEKLEVIQRQFAKRGGAFVIIGRFIPGGRSAVVISAGVLHFSWPTFLAYDAVAVVIWAVQAALPGYIGGSLISDRPWLAMVFGFALSVLLTASIALIYRWRAGGRAAETPIKPAVIGISTAAAAIEVHGHDDAAEGASIVSPDH